MVHLFDTIRVNRERKKKMDLVLGFMGPLLGP